MQLFAVSKGDSSVGLTDMRWTVDVGELDDYEGQREEVRSKFKEAFNTLAENVVVTFEDEEHFD